MNTIKVKITNGMPSTIGNLVCELARKNRIKPSEIYLTHKPSGIHLFSVAISNRNIGNITRAFDSLMFIPN